MGNCRACGHEYERHLFGGMCFYCDCKRATYDTENPVYLTRHDAQDKPHRNGDSAETDDKKTTRRLGNQ